MKKQLKVIQKVELVENYGLMKQLSRVGILLFISSIFLLGSVYWLTGKLYYLALVSFHWPQLILQSVQFVFFEMSLLFLSLLAHEGIHGLFFKVFGAKKVVFGFQKGLLYAKATGSFYQGWQYLIIALSPFIILTGFYWQLSQHYPLVAILLCSLHAAGCVGDFYFAKLILKNGFTALVEDTDTGFVLYQKNE